ncbi:MAG: molecular chaperone DnaJ [Methanobacteriota archaeon]
MTTPRDYYEILGVEKDASPEDVKRAYRQLALQYHPDRNKDPKAAETFKEVSEAYGVLGDPEKRRAYDLYGHGGVDSRWSEEEIFRGADFETIFRDLGFGGAGRGGFEDLFSQIFRGFGGAFGGGPARGRDLRVGLEVTLAEAAAGVEREIRVRGPERCRACRGTGGAGGRTATCRDCRGSGQVARVSRTGPIMMQRVGPCPRCRGSGRAATDPCPECEGAGSTEGERVLSVRVPPGVDQGTALRVGGQGEPGDPGAPPGDLYVVVHVPPDPRFVREGRDLYVRREVTPAQAALGTEVEVPTLEGTERVAVPPGTQPGTRFHLKGEGMPELGARGGRGDVVAIVDVKVPERLSADERRLYEELAALEGSETKRGLFDKVKDRFKGEP